MNRRAIIFCLSVAITNTMNYAMEDSFHNFESSDSKNKTNNVCQQASYFLNKLHELKSQNFEQVHPRHHDLPETRNRIIETRAFELQLILQACNNNNVEPQLSRWNQILFASQNTLKITSAITALLSQK